MHLMMQQTEPDDYLIATGTSHSVADFCERDFAEVGWDYRKYIFSDERFRRPAEIDQLVGGATKAQATLGWTPDRILEELVSEMVQSRPANTWAIRPELSGARASQAKNCQ